MNKFLSSWYWILFVSLCILFVALLTLSLQGCETYKLEDGTKVTRLSDGATEVLDKGAELSPAVQTALGGASVAFPALAGIFGVIAGSLGAFTAAYKKYRPQITAERDRADQYGSVTRAVVYAIEQFKASKPSDWEVLKEKLRSEFRGTVGPEAFAVIEALIEEFREEQALK